MRGTNTKNVIMIADDDLFVRKVIISALPDAQIVEITDGAEVEKIYREVMPDIVFLDIHLPNISGMDLIHPLLRADQGAYIVMLSADSSEENVKTAKVRGARGFLTKPFEKSRIMHYYTSCPTVKFS